MGWQVAVVFEAGLDLDSLRIILGQMPLWASVTPERKNALSALDEEFRLFWVPEPAVSLFSPARPDDPIANLVDLIPTIAEHHPRLSGLHLFGIEPSAQLQRGLAELGYKPVLDPDSVYSDRLRFAKPISSIPSVPQISLDASGWRSGDDFFQSFLDAVGAPPWHGHNFEALDDRIGEGGINHTEVPYRIVIRNANAIGDVAADYMQDFRNVIQHLQSNGCPVELVFE